MMEHSIYVQLEPGIIIHPIKLPITIDRAQTENLHIALKSLSLFLAPTPPDIGKLSLLELDGFHSGLVQDKILDIFKIEGQTVYKERKVLDFVKLTHHNIDTLTFQIVNNNDFPIILRKPGFLTLIIKTMDPTFESFNIHVSKEGVRKISTFKYHLPYSIPLKQTGSWKLALTSIVFPNPNVGKDTKLELGIVLGNAYKIHTFTDDQINNIRKFITVMQENVKRKLNLDKKKIFRVGITPERKIILLSDQNIQLTFSNRLAYLLGFTDEGYTQAGRTIKLVPNEEFVFPSRYDTERDVTEAVYVKCDQIAPSIANNTFDHILKLIPVTSKTQKYFYYETEQPEYHTILPTTLSHLNIQLIDQTFLPLPYKSSRFDRIMINFKIIHEK